MLNKGDFPAARLKSQMTRQMHGNAPAVKPVAGMVPDSSPTVAPTKVAPSGLPKLKPYRGAKKFLGSFAKGGVVQRTGLYLCHKGEGVVPAHMMKGLSRKSR